MKNASAFAGEMMKLYLDMDGVLVDFRKQAEKYHLYIGEEGINWLLVMLIGKKFWTSMEWLDGAQDAYSELDNFCKSSGHELHILSSVRLKSGKKGKTEWISEHTNIPEENITIVRRSRFKNAFAKGDALLIDDRAKNVEAFSNAGGNSLLFRGWSRKFVGEIKKILERK